MQLFQIMTPGRFTDVKIKLYIFKLVSVFLKEQFPRLNYCINNVAARVGALARLAGRKTGRLLTGRQAGRRLGRLLAGR